MKNGWIGEHFNQSFSKENISTAPAELGREKQNIVLIGMPSCGKSTVGKLLSEKLGRELVETDRRIAVKAGRTIPEIFASCGEAVFREMESKVIREVSAKTGVVIATGGGTPIRRENVTALSENGRLYFLDRPLECLIPTEDRPLSSTREAIERLYRERYDIYTGAADVRIEVDCDARRVMEKIVEDFFRITCED